MQSSCHNLLQIKFKKKIKSNRKNHKKNKVWNRNLEVYCKKQNFEKIKDFKIMIKAIESQNYNYFSINHLIYQKKILPFK